MAKISIIGTGNMGQALSAVLGKGGNSVDLIGHQDSTPVTGDIVVLAVPYAALADVIEKRRAELSGKVVIDITNPVNMETFDSLAVPADSSAAAEVAAAVPDAKVLKAFNTTFASTLVSGEIGGRPTAVLIAGDDADAKTQLAEAVTSGGLRAIDAGSLRRARELEAIGFQQITLAAQNRISWTGGFAIAD
jgi:8-hydroxy-5-deazaflavin:NADPH oxidoreductase